MLRTVAQFSPAAAALYVALDEILIASNVAVPGVRIGWFVSRNEGLRRVAIARRPRQEGAAGSSPG